MPDNPAHSLIRRWVVRLWRPGIASGSGVLVGPDLVLTCHHVLTDLLGQDGPGVLAAADEVEVTIGIGGRQNDTVLKRRLRLDHDSDGPAWLVPTGAHARLDFALLRLDDSVGFGGAAGQGPDWLSFKDIQSPAGLAEGAAGAPVSLFMYHYPDPGNGDPHIQPMLSEDVTPASWMPDPKSFEHRLETEQGSSGGMVFATVAGGTLPFPFAIHQGRVGTTPIKVSIPVSAVLAAIQSANTPIFRQLTMLPAELNLRQRLEELAAPKVELARSLLDRETPAERVVARTRGLPKRIQPIYRPNRDEAAKFQMRLQEIDLPLSGLADNARKEMRSWSLAGSDHSPPVKEGVLAWGMGSLGGDGWLQDGAEDATRAILERAAAERTRGAKILMTAQVDIRSTDDYRGLEALLLALETGLRDAAGDFMVLLWLNDDFPELTEASRQQARRVLSKLWTGETLDAVVGTPLELRGVAREDLDRWEGDIAGAFGVKASDVTRAVDTIWKTLDQPSPSASRHAFGRVLVALDDRLKDWVYLHFRRLDEIARIRR